MQTTFFAPDAFKDETILKIAGKAAEGVVCAAPHFNLSIKNGMVEKFVVAFKDVYKKDPNVFAAYGYDTAAVIAHRSLSDTRIVLRLKINYIN